MQRPYIAFCVCASLLGLGLLTLPFAAAQEPKAKEPMLTPAQQEKLKERDRLLKETDRFAAERKYKEAVVSWRKAIQINKDVYGADHVIVEGHLITLANYFTMVGEFTAVQEAREEILEGRMKKYGKDDWRTGDARRDLSDLDALKKLSSTDRLRLFRADQLNRQGVQLHGQGKTKDAFVKVEESLTIRNELLGEKHSSYAQSLNNLAALYKSQRQLAKAEPLYLKALDIRNEVLGEKHPDYAISLNNLAQLYELQGKSAKAETLYQRSLEIRKEVLGEKHPDYAISLNNLAAFYASQGQPAKAEPLHQKALDIRKDVLGEKHLHYASSLNNLAALYASQGQFAKAEPFYQQALDIHKEVLGEKHPDYASSLNNLATVYALQGQFAKAELFCQKALDIRKAALGEKHPDYAQTLNNLAELYKSQGQSAKAEPFYQKALKIYREVQGEKHADYANSLDNLALLYASKGQSAKAEPLFQKALKIRKEVLGEKHPDYALSLNHLGLLYGSQGQSAKAESFYLNALQIQKTVQGEKHPDYATTLNNLAFVYNSQGQYPKAERLLCLAIQIDRELLAHSAAAQTDQQQQLHAQYLRRHIDNLCLASFQQQEASIPRVYAEVLAWKGAITARQRQTRLVRTILQSNPDAETTKLLTDLNTVSRQLAALSLSPPDPKEVPDLPKRLQELSDKRDQLEKDLSRKTATFRKLREKEHLTPADLQKLLPAGVVLVDFFEYRSHIKEDEPSFIAAFVVTANGVHRVELGKVEPLAQAIDRFRAQMKRSQPIMGNDDPALVLREKLLEPLEKHLAGAKLILISPDGPLNRLPFAALPTKDGKRFLIEDHAIAILPVPQLLPELLERPIGDGRAEADSVLLVGGVAFDGEVKTASVVGASWAPRAGKLNAWSELPGTVKEVESLSKMFGERFPTRKAALLQKIEASEESVRQQIGKHRWVHLATHGFFSPPDVKAATLVGDQSSSQKLIGHDPRLLSGIVLAGANRSPQLGRDDGILTALEVGDLDLTRVELAVLSACETGLGEVAGGEGVLGLQRAFQVAGAGSVATTLWQIPDEPTRILMERFYENLWKGRGGKKFSKLEALREAQLWMLKEGKSVPGIQRGLVRDDLPEPIKDGRLPPYYWAAFMLSGDWR